MTEKPQLAPSGQSDPRPVVRTSTPGNLGLWVFLGLLLLGGAWIVSLMSAARREAEAPRTTIPPAYAAGEIAPAPPPPLPERFGESAPVTSQRYLPPVYVSADPRSVPQRVAPQPVVVPRRTSQGAPQAYPPYAGPVVTYREPFPSGVSDPSRQEVSVSQTKEDAIASTERVKAGRLLNPSVTIPLGTIIPAVLETALDSTRAGSVRALVQRDVRSFDGSRVLVPRGTRLYGAYKGELAEGQNRALVTWTRLLRPDGVTIALESDASDPLGRAGIKGKVDSKFFQRFGGAILQSILDIGVGLATREATNGVIVALPGSAQSLTRNAPAQITPTLTVRQGTSVSVYVARDLDFSSVE